ncbi:MAG: hypothetical protein KGI59_01600 [Patescibacteria group bacterium]|nr:hypothetical protein [Patescibacteria group bacterium]
MTLTPFFTAGRKFDHRPAFIKSFTLPKGEFFERARLSGYMDLGEFDPRHENQLAKVVYDSETDIHVSMKMSSGVKEYIDGLLSDGWECNKDILAESGLPITSDEFDRIRRSMVAPILS